jgi:hypothetical protein
VIPGELRRGTMQMHALASKMIGLGQIEAAKNIADSQLNLPAPVYEK